MRFRISTLLLVVAIFCVLIGWIIERRSYTKNLSEATRRESLVTSAISIAMTTNRLAAEHSDLLDSELTNRLRKQLWGCPIDC